MGQQSANSSQDLGSESPPVALPLTKHSDVVFRRLAVSMETEPAASTWLGEGQRSWIPRSDLTFEQGLCI